MISILEMLIILLLGYRLLFLDVALSVLLIMPKNNILLKYLNFKQVLHQDYAFRNQCIIFDYLCT